MNSTIGGAVLMILLIIIVATIALTLLGPAFVETKQELRESEKALDETEMALEDTEGALSDLARAYGETREDLEKTEVTLGSLRVENEELWADNAQLWQDYERVRLENERLQKELDETAATLVLARKALDDTWRAFEPLKAENVQLHLELANARQKLEPFWQAQERARLRKELQLKERRECVLLGLALAVVVSLLAGGVLLTYRQSGRGEK